MGWWNKAKDAVEKAGKDISDTVKKAGKDIKAEADRLAENAKKERDKFYPYYLTQSPAEAYKLEPKKVAELVNKKNLYIKLSNKTVLNKDHTYFSLNNCDGLIFDSLSGIGGADVHIEPYFRGNQWHRAVHKDCLKDSRSTISNDQLIGMTLWALWFKKKNIYDKTIKHLLHTNWIAGDATNIKDKISRVWVKPQIATMMMRADEYLGNKNKSLLECVPHFFSDNSDGYVRHLQNLIICCYAITDGKISPLMKKVIQRNVRAVPENVLTQFNYAKWITGNYEPVYSLLTNAEYWPHGRLPTNYDRNEKWLPERNSDRYKGVKHGKKITWSGMDYCFVVSLLEREH